MSNARRAKGLRLEHELDHYAYPTILGLGRDSTTLGRWEEGNVLSGSSTKKPNHEVRLATGTASNGH